MKKNIGKTDRIIRVIIALIIAVLILTNMVTNTLAIILGIFGVVLLLTSFMSFCPIYRIFGTNTCEVNKK